MAIATPHVPSRTCIVCGTKTAKSDLLRLVASSDGSVRVDDTGRSPGRGAYICKTADAECRRRDLKRSRLEYSLRASIHSKAWASLLSSLEAMAT